MLPLGNAAGQALPPLFVDAESGAPLQDGLACAASERKQPRRALHAQSVKEPHTLLEGRPGMATPTTLEHNLRYSVDKQESAGKDPAVHTTQVPCSALESLCLAPSDLRSHKEVPK